MGIALVQVGATLWVARQSIVAVCENRATRVTEVTLASGLLYRTDWPLRRVVASINSLAE